MSAAVQEIALPRAMPKVLGMGAHLKASLCLIDGDRAWLSRTAGDMETLEAVDDYQGLMTDMLERAGGADAIACAAHDLHPNFHTTTFAEGLGCATLAVQHHHAHTLATALEHGHEGPVLGLALDGFGLGPNDQSWGGELLYVDGLEYQRVGHLSLLPQPGGDIAAREPWRMGAAVLYALHRGDEIAARFADQPHAALLSEMLGKGINSPVTSSCGRLFDAACGLLGVCPVAEFEGQAPMALEALATEPYVLDGGWSFDEGGRLNLNVLLEALTTMDAGAGANVFHGTLAAALAEWVVRGAEARGVRTVAFGGGCFLNAVLTSRLSEALTRAGIEVLRPERLSPGDAGLSFGQAYAAALNIEKQ